MWIWYYEEIANIFRLKPKKKMHHYSNKYSFSYINYSRSLSLFPFEHQFLKISSWWPSSTMCFFVAFYLWSQSGALSVCLLGTRWSYIELGFSHFSDSCWGFCRTLIILNRHSMSWNTRATQKIWVIPNESPVESWSNIPGASIAVLLSFI